MSTTSTQTIDGRYILRQLLGQGASADVYRATDDLLKREVSIKIYRPSMWDNRDSQTFLREAKIAAGLKHPNLAATYSVGTMGQAPYIVMELIEGKTLAEHIATEGPLPVSQALQITEELCSAAHYLHQHGLIHRDIKPSNIVLSNREGKLTAHLIDLGLAKRQQSTTQLQNETMSKTAPGMTVGTPSYMSPEQMYGDKIDARSDVFALGAVLYEALTGMRAFANLDTNADPTEFMRHSINSAPEPMSEVCPDCLIPPAVENATLRAMSKNPDQRYDSAASFGQQLEKLREALVLGTTLPSIEKPQSSSYQQQSVPSSAGNNNKPTKTLAITAAIILMCLAATPLLLNWNHLQMTPQASSPQVPAHRNRLSNPGTEATIGPFENIEFGLRSACKTQKHLSLEDVQLLSNQLLQGVKLLNDQGHEASVRSYIDKIRLLAKEPSLPDRATVADRLFLPYISSLHKQGKLHEALTEALELVRIEERVAPGSAEEAYASAKVAMEYQANNDSSNAKIYLARARNNLKQIAQNNLRESEMCSLWLACAELERILSYSPGKRKNEMAMKYADGNVATTMALLDRLQLDDKRPNYDDCELIAAHIISLNTGDSANERLFRGMAKFHIGLVNQNRNKRTQAIAAYQSAIDELEPIENLGSFALQPLAQSRCYLAGLIYQQDLPRAEKLLCQSMRNCPPWEKTVFGLTCVAVGEAFIQKKQEKQAKPLLERSLELISPKQQPKEYLQVLIDLTKCTLLAGDTAGAAKLCADAESLRMQLGNACPPQLDKRLKIIKVLVAHYQR